MDSPPHFCSKKTTQHTAGGYDLLPFLLPKDGYDCLFVVFFANGGKSKRHKDADNIRNTGKWDKTNKNTAFSSGVSGGVRGI